MDNQSNFVYKSIAIVRLSSLGDIIHTLPAFYLLRQKYPEAKISWIVEPAGFQLLKNFSGIDELVAIDLKTKGISNKIKELKKILSAYRKSFDLIMDFQGLIKSAVLSYLLRGYTIGFHKKNLKEPLARFFYKNNAEYFREDRHVIFKNIHLLSLLNIVTEHVVYPLKDLTKTVRLTKFMSDNDLITNQYVIMNVGGGWNTKILETDQYVRIIKGLEKRYSSVILWGNENEGRIAEEISKQTHAVRSLYFNFTELIQFIKDACLVITGDTLAMHIADMVKTPSVGIFGPTSPDRNGSLLKDSMSIYKKLPCSFCYKKKCDTIDCLKQLDIEDIVNAADIIHEKCN